MAFSFDPLSRWDLAVKSCHLVATRFCFGALEMFWSSGNVFHRSFPFIYSSAYISSNFNFKCQAGVKI